MRSKLLALACFVLLGLGSGCSSGGPTPPGGNGILEAVDNEAVASPESVDPTVVPEAFEAPKESPAAEPLMKKLGELGYEGVGLQYEDPATLALLTKVFSHPAAARRKIKLVYTGHALAYDATAESLTIGGTDLNAILGFLRKKVPLQKPAK